MPKDFEIKRKVLIKYNGKSKNPVIPEGIKKIGKCAFEAAEIDSVKIPESVTEIGADAFRGSDIREIEIPESVTKIEKEAFFLCQNLRKINIPEKIAEMEEIPRIFCVCKRLEEVELSENMPRACGILSGTGIKKAELLPTETEIKPLAFIGCWKLREVIIPEGVTKIGYGAFATCESLQKIVLPEGMTEIDDKAFYGCRNLRTVVVPKSLKHVGISSFTDCPNLGVRTISKIENLGESIFAGDGWD
ncbi:MAG: leucine-rich repeat domain-containing protein [Oscillospiraceae bacterium]|nr:leucine-rich repeat domain-containing protein [Oscillospiraceae bacterium]